MAEKVGDSHTVKHGEGGHSMDILLPPIHRPPRGHTEAQSDTANPCLRGMEGNDIHQEERFVTLRGIGAAIIGLLTCRRKGFTISLNSVLMVV